MRPFSPIYPRPPTSTTTISAEQEKCKDFCHRLSRMHNLRDVHLRLYVYCAGFGEADKEDQDVLFEVVRALVEEKPGVVTLQFPWQNSILSLMVRWRESFGLQKKDPWAKLRCNT